MVSKPTLAYRNFKRISKTIERFISGYLSKSGATGLVVGLSRGLDSAVVLKLAVNALGSSRVLGLVLPSDVTPEEDIGHAIYQAESLGIKYQIININPLLQRYSEFLPDNKMAKGNLEARVRMNILYYYAAINDYLVAGTSDKSEVEIGFFTSLVTELPISCRSAICTKLR